MKGFILLLYSLLNTIRILVCATRIELFLIHFHKQCPYECIISQVSPWSKSIRKNMRNRTQDKKTLCHDLGKYETRMICQRNSYIPTHLLKNVI